MEILYKNNILEIEDLKVLGANNEGVVYQYKNNAIKIYHKHPKKFILTKDVCEQFTKIKTQQILMPNDLVYSKDKEYIGSATLYVDKKISPSSMWETLSNNLDQEQQVLDEDLNILTQNNIAVSELGCTGNFIYNQKMYFTDYGDYNINPNSNLKDQNQEELNRGLHNQLILYGASKEDLEEEFCKMTDYNNALSSRFIDMLVEIYDASYDELFSFNYQNYLEYLRDILKDYKSIEEYKISLIEQGLENDNINYDFEEEANSLKHIMRGR